MSMAARAGLAAIAAGLRLPRAAALETYRQKARTIDAMRKMDVDLVLDVGANKGFYSKHLRMMGFRGPIFAFEPEPMSYAQLAEAARGDPEWQVFNFALGDVPGEMHFNVITTGQETVLSSLLEPRGSQDLIRRKVAVRRLDDVLRERAVAEGARIFLKMDTQGYDTKVFAGGGDDRRIRLLQSEVSVVPIYEGMPHYTEALHLFESAGFELLDLFVVNRTENGGILEFDALMERHS